MAKKKKATKQQLSSAWRKTFPFEESEKVVQYVQETWTMLVQRGAQDIQPAKNEPIITKFLRSILENLKAEYGLTGQFNAEAEEAIIDWTIGTRRNVGRTDIKYFSDRLGIDITFEFKKLKKQSRSRKQYYDENGMGRFVSGKYSRDKHLGFMVGMISEDYDQVVQGLINAISKPDIASALHICKCPRGKYVRKPSLELPNVVEFDTEHARTLTKASPDIVLCHFYLAH